MIAKITCICTPPDQHPREVSIGVHAPQPHDKYEFSCLVALPDRKDPYEIFGVDSLQALSLGMSFAAKRIDDMLKKGWTFQWEDEGGQVIEVPMCSYFMPQQVLDELETIGKQGVDFYSKK